MAFKRVITRKLGSGTSSDPYHISNGPTFTTSASSSSSSRGHGHRHGHGHDGDDAAHENAIAALTSSPLSCDPVEFCLAAMTPILTYHPRHDPITIHDVIQHHVPRYFHNTYSHQTNCRELGLHGRLRSSHVQSRERKKAY